MTIKDWEKINSNTWENKANYQFIRIIKHVKNTYLVFVRQGNTNNLIKTDKFKTKSAALKFAKRYMRTH